MAFGRGRGWHSVEGEIDIRQRALSAFGIGRGRHSPESAGGLRLRARSAFGSNTFFRIFFFIVEKLS